MTLIVTRPLMSAAGRSGNCGPDKVEWRPVRACCAEAALAGSVLDAGTLVTALEQLQHDIAPATDKGVRAHSPQHAGTLWLRAFLCSCQSSHKGARARPSACMLQINPSGM